MKRLLPGMLCVVLSSVALAGGLKETRKLSEASMLITGSVTVKADGTILNYTLDHREKLPPAVVGLVEKNAGHWKFEPAMVASEAVLATAKMSLRIVAKPIDGKTYSVTIGGATFGDRDRGTLASDTLSLKSRTLPKYPIGMRIRPTGTVYVLMRVGRDGKVADVAAVQVNLGVVASDRTMQGWRESLAKSALDAVRTWTFNVPTTGKTAADPYWDARTSFNFVIGPASDNAEYGQWNPYIPGPRQPVPWMTSTLMADSVDSMPADSVSQMGQGLRLTTPLNGV